MIGKQHFISKLSSVGLDTAALHSVLGRYEDFADLAEELRRSMPGIGFASASQRMNCFIAVCRHLDAMIESGRVSLGDSQFVLMILRLSDKKFEKAITMFDTRGPRYSLRERAEMPRSAREYLAGLEMYG